MPLTRGCFDGYIGESEMEKRRGFVGGGVILDDPLCPQRNDPTTHPHEDSTVKRELIAARDRAMRMTMAARIPECGDFGAIAQALDYVVNKLYPEENLQKGVDSEKEST